MSNYHFKYETAITSVDLMVDMTANWFRTSAFDDDDEGSGVDYIDQMIDDEQWHVLHQLSMRDDMGLFNYHLAREVWSHELYYLILQKPADYIEQFLDVHEMSIIPIVGQFVDEDNAKYRRMSTDDDCDACDDSDIEDGVMGAFLDKLEQEFEDQEWSSAHLEKMLSIPRLRALIPESAKSVLKNMF